VFVNVAHVAHTKLTFRDLAFGLFAQQHPEIKDM
jgi:hypothetical protein